MAQGSILGGCGAVKQLSDCGAKQPDCAHKRGHVGQLYNIALSCIQSTPHPQGGGVFLLVLLILTIERKQFDWVASHGFFTQMSK